MNSQISLKIFFKNLNVAWGEGTKDMDSSFCDEEKGV